MPGRWNGAPQPIGVFDSGIGGLSVVGELRRVLPHEDILYFADNGPLSLWAARLAEIRALVTQGAEFCWRGAKVMVVACNTASAAGLRPLRVRYGPVVPGSAWCPR